MTTAKAKYKGDGSGMLIPDFSDSLKAKLRAFYPKQDADGDPEWGDSADSFVAHILSEAWQAKSELHWQNFESRKQEIRAEHADLSRALQDCEHKLRNLSPDFDRLLGFNADPLACADQIKAFIEHVVKAGEAIKHLSKRKRPYEKQHAVAVEMALCVLRALREYGIQPAATGDAYYGYKSDAVVILKLIGDDIGIRRDELTWRDTIIKAKQIASDLQ